MPIAPGTHVGSYEVIAAIGAGGMGEVYRARDTRLNRDVALKSLPELFATDPERRARFEREAQVLASLNHPHIAQIYGVEESNDIRALVMELVDGETLADRIARGPIRVDVALPIARQIAEALEAAHEQGIVHRDLKPANIKVRDDGTVKVLDFGLAKLTQPAIGGSLVSPALSPTITSPALMTGVGTLLGTAAYMSPEQAKGKEADKRSDIWAFGCVFFEMLTGVRPFDGDDVTEAIASVVKSEPAWHRLPPLDPLLGVFLRQCLVKDPRRRLGDIREMRLALENGFAIETLARGPTPNRSRRVLAVTALVAAVGGAVAAAAVVLTLHRPPGPTGEVIRFDVLPPLNGTFPGANNTPRMELSPDGRYLAFTSAADETAAHQLWIRPLDSVDAKAITQFAVPTGEPVQQPFWSPDSQSLGFFIQGSLRRINVDGTGMRTLAMVPGNNYGGTWGRDGTILFSSSQTGGLRRVAASGGPATQVTTVDANANEVVHYWPQFMPDGRHFLYLAAFEASGGMSGLWAGSLDSPQRTLVLPTTQMARFSAGYLLYVQDGSLLAQRMNADTLTLQGEPVVVTSSVQVSTNSRPGFTVSANNVLAYRRATGSLSNDSQLAWVNREGVELGVVGLPASIRGLDLSIDGRTAVVHREEGEGAGDVWLLDLDRGTNSRVTFDPARHNVGPIWGRTGQVIFGKVRANRTTGLTEQRWALFERTGEHAERQLIDENLGMTVPWSVSPDGSMLVFSARSTELRPDDDLWSLPLVGNNAAAKPLIQGPGQQGWAQFSPDGRWLAYVSDETGQNEVYVQGYPPMEVKSQVSIGGGSQPRWRRDGRELFYRAPQAGSGLGTRIQSVEVEAGPPLRFGTPRALFRTDAVLPHVAPHYLYAPSPEGQRFLVVRRSGLSGPAAERVPVTVVVNWTEELKHRFPTR